MHAAACSLQMRICTLQHACCKQTTLHKHYAILQKIFMCSGKELDRGRQASLGVPIWLLLPGLCDGQGRSCSMALAWSCRVITSKIIPMPLPTPEVVDMIASIDNMTFATHPCPMQRFCTSLHQWLTWRLLLTYHIFQRRKWWASEGVAWQALAPDLNTQTSLLASTLCRPNVIYKVPWGVSCYACSSLLHWVPLFPSEIINFTCNACIYVTYTIYSAWL